MLSDYNKHRPEALSAVALAPLPPSAPSIDRTCTIAVALVCWMAAVCQPHATLLLCPFSFNLHYIIPHSTDTEPCAKSHSYGGVRNRADAYLTCLPQRERIQQVTGYPEECVSAFLFLKEKPSFWYLHQKIPSSASDFQMIKKPGLNQKCLLLNLFICFCFSSVSLRQERGN